MNRWFLDAAGSALAAVLIIISAATSASAQRYDVVIAGGSTAALAAAFSAAEEGATVALLEPTDWIGGQLTSSGVPAVDEAWHKIRAPRSKDGSAGESGEGRLLLDVAAVARDPRNMTPYFRDVLAEIGNPGQGWVSRFCFEPRILLEGFLEPRERDLAGKLTVYRETVVKRVETDGREVKAIVAIRRTPRPSVDSYDTLPSRDLADWYSAEDSDRFTKETLRFEGAVFIDATEWGEVLALADAPYLQGVETSDGALEGDDTLGQATVFCFAQRVHEKPVADHPAIKPVEGLGFASYESRPNAWPLVWTYRRLKGRGPTASPGEVSLQNWGYSSTVGNGGNDYPFGYLFTSRALTSAQRNDWRGGVDLDVMAAAEARALAWHDWFRRAAPDGIDPDQFTLDGEVFGSKHGLAKLPYIRDTRRSVGLGGFVLKLSDLIGVVEDGKLDRLTGTEFPDRIALGAYAADIHPLVGYQYPPDVHENHPTLPFYLPLRSLTNDGYDNLMVAGKTMAQTFLANSATRLHPIEWSTGVACGVVAADLARSGASTSEACEDYERLREKVARHTPVDWVIPDSAVAAD